MDMENLAGLCKDEMDEGGSQDNQATAIQLLLQGTDNSGVIHLDESGNVLGTAADIEMVEADAQGNVLQSELCVTEHPDHVTMNEINDMSGMDIVTLQQSGQVPSMFHVVTSSSGESSFVIPDGQIMQTESVASDEHQDIKTIHLPNGITLVQKQDEKENCRVVEGQIIELDDGSTRLLQAGVHGQETLQSVQLEDGSTAYITAGLFADHSGPLNIDIAPSASDIHPSLEIATNMQSQIVVSKPLGIPVSTSGIVKVEPNEAVVSVVNSLRGDIMSPSPQPHVSDRALALGDKAYKCLYEGCGRLYTTQHHLKVHERSHTGDRPFRCEFPGCAKAFATGYGLKSHTRVHTGEKPYRCPDIACAKSFKTSGDLQKHVRTHTGERPFRCPFEGCDRSFTTSNIRKVHIRTHTGEKPYICMEDGCSKAFASATNYKNHIRIHTGEKPYVCTVEGCGKRFTEYSSLYKHHVVHTQSKPYICNHCNKTYRQTSTLAMHKRTIHNDHDINLEMGDGLITTISGMQIVNTLQKEGISESEREAMEDDQALVINTTDQALGGGAGNNAAMLSALQTAPVSSAALLQQLQPAAALSVPGTGAIQQVYLITDPLQIETLKRLAAQHQSTDSDLSKSMELVTSTAVTTVSVPSAITCDSTLLTTEANIVISQDENQMIIPSAE